MYYVNLQFQYIANILLGYYPGVFIGYITAICPGRSAHGWHALVVGN